MSELQSYSTPNAAKCRENSNKIQRDIDDFLSNGGKITQIESELITETTKAEKLKNEAARQRGMKKFNGGTPK